MLDYEKILNFCLENELDFGEFMLLYTLEMRNQQYKPEIHSLMDKYFNSQKTNYKKIIEDLEERGFLTILKPIKGNNVIVRNLQISNKFTDALFVDVDEVFNELVRIYPSEGISPNGNGLFAANIIKAEDRDYFKNNILKNSDRVEARKIIDFVKSKFEYDERLKKPTLYATLGFSRFLLNYKSIREQWEKENKSKKVDDWMSERL